MSRPGDWRCPQCNNHNFKFRTCCNRCQAEKPDDASIETPKSDFRGKIRPGDWTCCGCENRNFAFRDVCNRCDLPRYVTQTFYSASLLDDECESCPGLGLQLLMTDSAALSSIEDVSQPLRLNKHDRSAHSPRATRRSSRKHLDSQNWRCTFCWNLNYEFRVLCNRCQLPQGATDQLTSAVQYSLGVTNENSMPFGKAFYTQPTLSDPWGVQVSS